MEGYCGSVMRRSVLVNGLKVYLLTHVERGGVIRVSRKALAEQLQADENDLLIALGLLKATGGADFRIEEDGTVALSRECVRVARTDPSDV